MPLVPRSPAKGDAPNRFDVSRAWRFTHIRLCMYPDGGVARLRVHGEGVPTPATAGAVDLAALEHGGEVTGCSNMFYSSPRNLISPAGQGDGRGLETARRRDDGNDWSSSAWPGPGWSAWPGSSTLLLLGNAPGRGRVRAVDARAADPADPGAWTELLPRARLLPDTRHRFRLDAGGEATAVRLDVYPDGAWLRVRLVGQLAPAARDELALRWLNLLPEGHARPGPGQRGRTGGRRGRPAGRGAPWTAWPRSPSSSPPSSAADRCSGCQAAADGSRPAGTAMRGGASSKIAPGTNRTMPGSCHEDAQDAPDQHEA